MMKSDEVESKAPNVDHTLEEIEDDKGTKFFFWIVLFKRNKRQRGTYRPG